FSIRSRDIQLDPKYRTPGSIYGHPALPEALTVGAISFPATPLDPQAFDRPADYSARGPSQVLDALGVLHTVSTLDVLGMDNVSVSGSGGFVGGHTFIGTSAAAPHVAAIAALLR